MRETRLTIPEVGLLAGTRAAFGAGAALLLADRLDRGQRKALGWLLLTVGIATTFPLVALVLGRRR